VINDNVALMQVLYVILKFV